MVSLYLSRYFSIFNSIVLLSQSLPPSLPPCSAQVKLFVDGLFHLNNDIPQFKEHLRDFLVQIKVRPN